MKLFFLTALTMVAFAANSVLNKFGVSQAGLSPGLFALIRIVAGAVMLAAILVIRDKNLSWLASGRVGAVVSLTVYMCGFSLAYLTLDAGVGALILFGMVQLTMFAVAVARGDVIPTLRWIGIGVALGGLAYLLWPAGGDVPNGVGAVLMLAAGAGWGFYSLLGAGAKDALAATAANFVFSVPLVAVVLATQLSGDITPAGLLAACVSGAITSALGYALWYQVLPKLETSVAASAQLSVPVIAVLGGAVLLSEDLTARILVASLLVLGGIGMSLRR